MKLGRDHGYMYVNGYVAFIIMNCNNEQGIYI